MATGAEDWRQLSAFDDLDESWVEGGGSKGESVGRTQPLAERDQNGRSDVQQKDLKGRPGAATAARTTPAQSLSPHSAPMQPSTSALSLTTSKSNTDAKETTSAIASTSYAHLPAIQIQKKGKARRRASDGEARGQGRLDMLQPGPSSPSLRLASHQRSASEERLGSSDEIAFAPQPPAVSEALLRSAPPSSKSSSSSEEKRGSISMISDTPDKDSGEREREEHEDDDQFGSAREEQSLSQAFTAVADATCIEYSQVESLPDEAGPEWKKKAKQGNFAGKDLLHKPKSQLRTMFEGMYEAQEEAQRQRLAAEAETGAADLGRGKGEHHLAGEVEKTEANGPEVWVDISGERRSTSSERDERETEGMLAQVPQCTFTFASPVVALEAKQSPPLATPSKAHGLLRLLPHSATRADIEQIINTPRSERKGKDAFKLVSDLVEEERGERESKRVRVDRQPFATRSLVATSTPRKAVQSSGGHQHTAKSSPGRGQLTHKGREGYAPPGYGNQEGLTAKAGTRTSSVSVVMTRRGAKAPTPETSLMRGRVVRPLSKGQSPRKILRLWSAANQVDEEIEQEAMREAETAQDAVDGGGEWLDVPDQDTVEVEAEAEDRTKYSVTPKVPILSIDPPTQRGLEEIVSSAKGTTQPGMLHISPEDVNLHDLENIANGRMSFDRVVGRWIPAKIKKQQLLQQQQQQQPGGQKVSGTPEGQQIDSSDEVSNDPFQDIESLISQSSVMKVPHSHAPQSQSALRNEVQLSDTTGSSTTLSSPREMETRQGNLLSAPKTPQPASLNQHSPTPRSILKTGRSMLTLDSHSPTGKRPEARSISFADSGQPVSQQRVEKVEELLRQLAELALGPDDSMEEMAAPRQQTPSRMLNFTPPTAAKGGVRSPWGLSLLRSRGMEEMGNASFLTNASFNVAHDRIIELITDVAPWEPGWHELKKLDLTKRRVESLVRLKDYLPNLEEALLDDNEISYLTGLPASLRLLSVSRNRLPPTVSFGHLMNLESLDISFNHVDDSLMSLSVLVHLRHLRAEENGLCSIDGIEHLAKLETLNLRSNQLQAVNIASQQWPHLKDLLLSHNDIVAIRGVSNLKVLRCLNLDHNNLSHIDLGKRMPRLKQLRLSGNHLLSSLDVGSAVGIRTLYADDCSLREVRNLDRLHKLDNLSLRQQNGNEHGINWPAHQTRDIKRLFLSGNAFKSIELSNRTALSTLAPAPLTKFYSMVYLELSACQLASLPLDLSELVPNLRHLNADYNLFETLPPLGSLHRLKRFSVIGCRISKSRKVVESLYGCSELAVLDVRMNPCTMGLYPPILFSTAHQGPQVNRAFLPPIPHPDVARPDLRSERTATDKEKDAGVASLDAAVQQSFFHKRAPGPDLSAPPPSGHQQREQKGVNKESALFVASDSRFFRTLPAEYRLQRLLHRGALAMACPNLTWLDGLVIDEAEVQQADDYFQGRARSFETHQQSDSDSASSNSSSGSTFNSI